MDKYPLKGRLIRYSARGAGLSYKSFGGNILENRRKYFQDIEGNVFWNNKQISREGAAYQILGQGTGLSYKSFGGNISEKKQKEIFSGSERKYFQDMNKYPEKGQLIRYMPWSASLQQGF